MLMSFPSTASAGDKSETDLAAEGPTPGSQAAAEASRTEDTGADDSIVSIQDDDEGVEDSRVSADSVGDVSTNDVVDDDNDDVGDDTVEYDVTNVSEVLDSAPTSDTPGSVEE